MSLRGLRESATFGVNEILSQVCSALRKESEELICL